MPHEEREERQSGIGMLPADLERERGTLPWPTLIDYTPPPIYAGGGGPMPVEIPGVTAPPLPGSSPNIPFTPPPVNPQLLAAARGQSSFLTVPFTAGLLGTLARAQEKRSYFFIQNTSAVGDLYVGFGTPPIPGSALVLTPGAAFEPFRVPTNDIFVQGTAPNMVGILLIGAEGDTDTGNF
ncbi:MAG: hypothetical protein AB7Q37_18735 [Pyrinomonadaceae bacterium]